MTERIKKPIALKNKSKKSLEDRMVVSSKAEEHKGHTYLALNCTTKTANELEKLGPTEQFMRFMELFAPDYVSKEMISWGPSYHSGHESYRMFLKDEKVVQTLDIWLLCTKEISILDNGAMGWGPKIGPYTSFFSVSKGIAIQSHLSEYAGVKLKNPGNKLGHSSYNGKGNYFTNLDSDERNELDVVLTSILKNQPLSKSLKQDALSGLPIFTKCGSMDLYIFNPTKKRAKEAAGEFSSFMSYVKKNKAPIEEATKLIYALKCLSESASKDSAAGKIILGTCGEYMSSAQGMLDKMKKQDFSSLAGKTLHKTNTSYY